MLHGKVIFFIVDTLNEACKCNDLMKFDMDYGPSSIILFVLRFTSESIAIESIETYFLP